jgi:16S rRNA (guanine1207-N2)-methyltransferase
MVEQAFHILRPQGTFIVHSAYSDDQLFPAQLKKVFGKVHAPEAAQGRVLWALRHGDRPRRRHEMSFHARVGSEPSLSFVTRPGTFAYGRFDDGARALVETMMINPGDRILDVGCGCGTNGVFAGRLSGPSGTVVFVDSNVRAIALAEHNARSNGLSRFETVASHTLDDLATHSFDVVLANPPYYAQQSIARRFIECGQELLKRGGRFYLVTRQPDALGPMIADTFGRADVTERRGYVVLTAEASAR